MVARWRSKGTRARANGRPTTGTMAMAMVGKSVVAAVKTRVSMEECMLGAIMVA